MATIEQQPLVPARPRTTALADLGQIVRHHPGAVLGLVAGFLGGLVDIALMRITDVFLTMPSLPLLVLIAAVAVLTNPLLIAGLISITAWGGLARAVRSQVLSYREREYIEAARS